MEQKQFDKNHAFILGDGKRKVRDQSKTLVRLITSFTPWIAGDGESKCVAKELLLYTI